MKTFIPILLSAAVMLAAHAEMKLGLQTYTFRKNTLSEVFAIAQNLGLRYLQVFPGQELGGGLEGKMDPSMPQATREALWAAAKAHGLEIVAYGVTKPKNEAGWRALLAFAKERGIAEIESEPLPEDLPMIAKLAAEYGVRVGAHNHPKGSAYSDPANARSVIAPYLAGTSVRLAPDTGHWLRAGFDPVAELKADKGMMSSLHFKDLHSKTDNPHDVPWGSGVSDAKGQLAELRAQNFDGILFIEYEKLDADLYDNVAKCVDYFRRAQAAPLADLAAGKVPPAAQVPADLARKDGVVVKTK